MRTFKCDFGSGVTCEIQVPDELPSEIGAHIQNVAWTGRPTEKLIRPYIAWMNSVNEQLANEWGARLAHVFQVSKDVWEMWVYTPGERPELVKDF